jgi:phenylacetate-CoA ligase
VYAWLVPRVVFPLAERLGGRRMWTDVRRMRELQWRPPEAVERRASGRLRALLEHATAHVPYYRELFKQVGLRPDDVCTLPDLARVPISTKADLRAGFPSRTTAENVPAHRRRTMRTSGSTGLPFEFYWDRAAGDALLAGYLFSLEWAGTAIWDLRITLTIQAHVASNLGEASRLRGLARRVLLGEQTASLSSSDVVTGEFRALIERLPARRHYFIRGVPTAIARLAAQLDEQSAALARYPKVVMTFAETLTPANAAIIKRLFRCPVVNYYSSWEVPQMAQTCPDNPDLLHVNSERVIVRVVRPDGHAAAPGEAGRVVVTDLANHAMPFINYFIGDHAVAGPPCPCGRGFPTLASLEGRNTEAIHTPAGKEINPGILGHVLVFVADIVPYVWEYQAVQTAPDAVTLRVVPTLRYSAGFANTLRAALVTLLGPDVTVAVEVVDHIPLEPSGKRLIIKSCLS